MTKREFILDELKHFDEDILPKLDEQREQIMSAMSQAAAARRHATAMRSILQEALEALPPEDVEEGEVEAEAKEDA